MSLDTIANVKLAMNKTDSSDDDLLVALMAQADAFIATYCGRAFEGGNFTEDHSAGSPYLFLANYPVSTIYSVKLDPNRAFDSTTELAATAYIVHAGRGVLEAVAGTFGRPAPAAVRVEYATADETVPPAVQRAYADLIGHWFRQAKTRAATDQQNLLAKPDGTTYPWGQSGGFKLPMDVKQVLDLYREVRV